MGIEINLNRVPLEVAYQPADDRRTPSVAYVSPTPDGGHRLTGIEVDGVKYLCTGVRSETALTSGRLTTLLFEDQEHHPFEGHMVETATRLMLKDLHPAAENPSHN